MEGPKAGASLASFKSWKLLFGHWLYFNGFWGFVFRPCTLLYAISSMSNDCIFVTMVLLRKFKACFDILEVDPSLYDLENKFF